MWQCIWANAVQTGRQCVCPHPNKEQVDVSALILFQAFHSVFLSCSLFYLSLSDYCHSGCCKKKKKTLPEGRLKGGGMRYTGFAAAVVGAYKAPRVGAGFW